MFKNINNLLSSATSCLDKNKNSKTAEQNSAKNNKVNATNTEEGSAVEHINADIHHRKTSEAKDVIITSTQKKSDIEDSFEDAIDNTPNLATKYDLDFEEEAIHLTKEDAQSQPCVEPEETYCYKALLNLISGIVNTSIFSETIKASYKVVVGNSNLTNINELIDGFNDQIYLDEALLDKLNNIEEKEFYILFTSQIIAKNPDVVYHNTFVNHLCEFRNYIKLQVEKCKDTANIKGLTVKIEKIIKEIIAETFKQIKQNYIINTKALSNIFVERDINKYNNDKIKRQFIDDLGRFNTNFKLTHQQQEFWNSRKLQQDNQKFFDDSCPKAEINKIKESFFNECRSKVIESIVQYNPRSNQEIIKAIMLEVTQSGMALASGIVAALKDSVFKDLSPQDTKYITSISNDYTRDDAVIDVSEGNVRISTSFTFNKAITLYDQDHAEIINSGTVAISYSLDIDPNDTTKAEYKDIQIHFDNN